MMEVRVWLTAHDRGSRPRDSGLYLLTARSAVPNFLPSLEVEGVEEASDEELDEAQVAGTV